MNKLLEGLKEEFNWTLTENGALTHRSTMDKGLDLFYHAPAKRGQDITGLFADAYKEDALAALKIAFYVRDIRGGQGEREAFRQMLRWLQTNHRVVFNALVHLVPEYGRWDDLVEFVDNRDVVELVRSQLVADLDALEGKESVSLLAKWMPSVNTSSKKTRDLAHKWIRALGINEPLYRKGLAALRERIGIVERLMSAGKFGEIDYSKVPSRSSLIYRKAFGKRDTARYGAYLEAVKQGEKTIKASTLYPYDLVNIYTTGHLSYYHSRSEVDDTIELQWKALPNYADSEENALVMCDVSGSMFQNQPRAIDISVSLAIYIAERNRGAFKNNFITFTDRPRLVELEDGSLMSKVNQVFGAGVGYSTNIQAAFDMLLRVATRNNIRAEDMPTKIFVVSDMEFDACGGGSTNFETIKRKFEAAGFVMPTLIFWNVASRNKQTPVKKNEQGVYLVSGASPSILKNALNTKAVTPLDMLFDVINGDRYAAIEQALLDDGFSI